MKQKTLKVSGLSLMLVLMFCCFFPGKTVAQSSNSYSRTYDIDEFSELFLEGAFGVELIQGKKSALEVKTSDERAFDYLTVTNRGDLLHLHVDRRFFDFSKVTLFVTFEDLSRLRILGGIRLETRGFLDLDDLDMLLEGGAKVKLKLKGDHISVDNRGGVLCEISGVAKSLNVRLAGAGHVNAGDLQARDVTFRIEGVGTGLVHATKTLDATIKGAGKIRFRGTPAVTQSIEGLGSVERQ
ncbi:Putative auto-transporter adhesin, head GIN domain [Mariniphaga anaerophila]|uniref:Putative auto-transporter adhesin, head GIN domain n=1 Tax=Mariniphaga anaerophila TaxID=1484053 RepID=A0A1M4XNH1_9BACT|nr:head GIN domain-containing protein [Mariniphaga anaerophila]SHE94823.1 Putative auto-transporter adhesin, head GIN domain [Mariniphaga anaerophila]